MTPQRLFSIVVALALLLLVALTVREVSATAEVISNNSAADVFCASLPSRESLRMKYEEERDAWIISTEDGPTGVDGGLIQLLSYYRDCSE